MSYALHLPQAGEYDIQDYEARLAESLPRDTNVYGEPIIPDLDLDLFEEVTGVPIH